MRRLKWWHWLLGAIGAGVAVLFLVVTGAMMIGASRPETFSHACVASFDGSPRDLWTRLDLPDTTIRIRENESGERFPATAGDTRGQLAEVFEADSLMVHCFHARNASVVTLETFTRDGGRTVVRVETWASLRTPAHRLTFPPTLKKQDRERLLDIARAMGVSEPAISEAAATRHSALRDYR